MHGNVSFLELGSVDTEKSRPFFERVFGWSFHPMSQDGGNRGSARSRVAATRRVYASDCIRSLEAVNAQVGIRTSPRLPGTGHRWDEAAIRACS